MGELAVKATMAAIATGLESVDGIDKAWPYPEKGVASEGQGVVGYPTFNLGSGAFRRVLDSATFPVLIVAGVAGLEATLDKVDALIAGASDVKDAIEAALVDVVEFANVSGGSVERIRIGRVDHAAVRFDVEVTA